MAPLIRNSSALLALQASREGELVGELRIDLFIFLSTSDLIYRLARSLKSMLLQARSVFWDEHHRRPHV